MKRLTRLLIMSTLSLSLGACGNDAEEKAAATQAGTETKNNDDGTINNVIDCAQYPSAEAQRYADDYLPDCRQWAQSQGYTDGVVLPMDTAAKKIDLASGSITCPAVKAGNAGYYCIGLEKLSR
jgi:hypothetical protein